MVENDRYIFRTEDGSLLYIRRADRRLQSTCGEDCLKSWAPVVASGNKPRSVGEWESFTGVDGKLQWAYRGRPVYTYRPALAAPDDALSGKEWEHLQP